MKTDKKTWLMGDTIELNECNNCGELIEGWGEAHWEDDDFTLCKPCVLKIAESFNSKSESIKAVYSKKAIPNSIRWKIWERDNFTCQYCGSRSDLTIDHIHPESLGGNLAEGNLATVCRSCNSQKGIKSKDDFRRLLDGN